MFKNSHAPSGGPTTSNVPSFMAPPMINPPTTTNSMGPSNFMVPGKTGWKNYSILLGTNI